MKIDLKGKVAVITGAGGGIGREIALRLSALGMKIVLLGGTKEEKLLKTQSLLSSDSIIIQGDLTDFSKLDEFVQKTISAFDGVDVLINNAGVAQNTPFENISEQEYDKIMTVNAKAPYFLTQKLLPTLRLSETPTVINISSIVGRVGYPMQSVYSASKHALLGFTESLARETYKEGIRVHAICPGGVYTDMVKVSRPDLSPEGMIMPEDIADVVEFLLTHRTNAVIDEVKIHRCGKEPF